MTTEELRMIALAFGDGLYGLEMDRETMSDVWNNCGFCYEVCL